MKLFLKYLGYFSAVAGCIGTIYGIGVFFANIQSDIKAVANTVSDIKTEQIDQSGKIESIEFEVIEISALQLKQGLFNRAIDKSYRDHLRMSKDLIDEYTKYLELQIENEKKKNFTDSIMLKIDHSNKIEKIKL